MKQQHVDYQVVPYPKMRQVDLAMFCPQAHDPWLARSRRDQGA